MELFSITLMLRTLIRVVKFFALKKGLNYSVMSFEKNGRPYGHRPKHFVVRNFSLCLVFTDGEATCLDKN